MFSRIKNSTLTASILSPDTMSPKNNNATDLDDQQRIACFEQLKQRENQWWQAHQHLAMLKERQMFWFGDNSLMMWLLWQFVSYIVVATLLMLLSSLLDWSMPLWQYISIFMVQTLLFIVMFASRGRLVNRLQFKIGKADLAREEALDEMTILASHSLFKEIHKKSPLSLEDVQQHIHQYYGHRLHLASLHRLLQTEVESGHLMLTRQKVDASILPIELADEELADHAQDIIYKSLI